MLTSIFYTKLFGNKCWTLTKTHASACWMSVTKPLIDVFTDLMEADVNKTTIRIYVIIGSGLPVEKKSWFLPRRNGRIFFPSVIFFIFIQVLHWDQFKFSPAHNEVRQEFCIFLGFFNEGVLRRFTLHVVLLFLNE